MRAHHTLSILALALAVGCSGSGRPPDVTLDLDPPYLLGIEPGGNAVAADAEFVLRFSEPMRRSSVFYDVEGEEFADGVALGLAENEDYLVSALKYPPLSATQRAKTISVDVQVEDDGAALRIRPIEPLEGPKDYIFVISERLADARSNRIVLDPETREVATQVIAFSTGAGVDRMKPRATLVSPPAGAQGVATGLREVKVAFSEAISAASLRKERIGLVEAGEGGTRETIVADSVTLELDQATFTLAERGTSGCRKLCPAAQYQLFVSPDVTDLEGNSFDTAALSGQTFVAANCSDEAAPRIAAASVFANPGDTGATVIWKTDERSTSRVEYLAGTAAALQSACSGQSATCKRATGQDSACDVSVCQLPGDEASFACQHSVRLGDLLPSTTYAYRVLSEDAEGRVTTSAAKSFTTVAGLPKIVLNELFVSPNAPISTSAGEFVELFNAGSESVDLANWKLAKCPANDCSTNVDTASNWTLKAATGSSTTLAPGAYAVVTGTSFNAGAYAIPSSAIHLNGRTSTLASGGLTDTTADGYALVDATGLVVSTYGGHLGKGSETRNKGKSFERRAPNDPDEASSWILSTTPVTGAPTNFASPGAPNGTAG